MTDYAPFAPTIYALPAQLSPREKKDTGHIFAECPGRGTPVPKQAKNKTCPVCWEVLTTTGKLQRAEQEIFDRQWHARQGAEAEAPTVTPAPLPQEVPTPKEERPMNASTVTERQLAYLKSLFAERKSNATAMAWREGALDAYKEGTLTRSLASDLIDRLKKIAKDGGGSTAPRPTLPDVPAGHYAIPSTGSNDLAFYRVDRPTEGKWAGRTFVKLVVGGQPDTPAPWKNVPGILTRILEAGVAESARLYGQEIGRCWRCNRTLTDETSRREGIGPECAKAA